MPRFVILEHDHPALHWDLMLETGGVLRTWRLLSRPQPRQVVAAEPIFDHRKLYLDYEGPVSGNRGTVRRWDHGTYEPELQAAASAGMIVVSLRGQKLQGTATLREGAGGWSFEVL